MQTAVFVPFSQNKNVLMRFDSQKNVHNEQFLDFDFMYYSKFKEIKNKEWTKFEKYVTIRLIW